MTERYTKRFLEWITKKQQIDTSYFKPPHINEGEVWWCSIGENVDIEISGKGTKFSRPVLVVKKFGKLSFLGIPFTTNSSRKGTWFLHLQYLGIEQVAMLSQARVLSCKRLCTRIGSINKADYKRIKEAYVRLLD